MVRQWGLLMLHQGLGGSSVPRLIAGWLRSLSPKFQLERGDDAGEMAIPPLEGRANAGFSLLFAPELPLEPVAVAIT